MTRAAIVTTLKSQGPSLATFVRYHLAIGFERIYLMFDNPRDPDIALVEDIEAVRVVPVDSSVRDRWSGLNCYDRYREFIDEEVRARQALNAEVALGWAREEGIDWLLHIDSDELFWPREATIHPHLERLAKDGWELAQYYNFEAVPEVMDTQDYFLDVTGFKKPRKLLEKQGVDVRAAWTERRKYFNFYSNGKSLCRVGPDICPNDVHQWKSLSGGARSTRFFYPAILHYSCCGYSHFRLKYDRLIEDGYVASVFGTATQKDKGFFVDYHATMAYRAGNEKKARNIYRNSVYMAPERVAHYQQAGIIERFDVAARIAAAAPQPARVAR